MRIFTLKCIKSHTFAPIFSQIFPGWHPDPYPISWDGAIASFQIPPFGSWGLFENLIDNSKHIAQEQVYNKKNNVSSAWEPVSGSKNFSNEQGIVYRVCVGRSRPISVLDCPRFSVMKTTLQPRYWRCAILRRLQMARKLCYRKDDRAMRPIHFSWAFVPIDPMNVPTKFEVRSFTCSWVKRG